MLLQKSSPFSVGLKTVITLFPSAISFLAINPLSSIFSKIALCFFKLRPQKLTRAVWLSSPYSTSFIMISLII